MSYQHKQVNPHPRHRGHRQSLKRQRGVVIIVALFIVALVATMAYTMMSRMERDTRRTTLLLRATQAEFYAQGSIAWAMDQLRNNGDEQKPNQRVDIIPLVSQPIEVDGYTIVSTILDMQARFNVNNVTSVEAQADFKKLLRTVDPNLNEDKAQQIVLAVADWIRPVPQQNEYTKYYLQLPKPYRSANRPMQSISELQLIKGMTPALYQALQPYVTALPKPTPVNVQTASVPVLMSLSPTFTLEVANAIEQIRQTSPFTSLPAFTDLDVVKNHQIADKSKLTVISTYFLVETNVAIEKQHTVLYTLLERTANQGKTTVSILWQSKGVW
jgi:general secretion pathway protein K